MKNHAMRFRQNKRRKNERGAAAVELAIVLPLLILIGIATIDLGRAAHGAIALDNAARAAAERGATKQYTTYTYAAWKTAVEVRAREDVDSVIGKIFSETTTTVTTVAPASGQLNWVTVSCQGTFRTLIDWKFLPTSLVITRKVTMRQFR